MKRAGFLSTAVLFFGCQTVFPDNDKLLENVNEARTEEATADASKNAALAALQSAKASFEGAESTHFNALSNLSLKAHEFKLKRSPFALDLLVSSPTGSDDTTLASPMLSAQVRLMQGFYYFGLVLEGGLGQSSGKTSDPSQRYGAAFEIVTLIGPVISRVQYSPAKAFKGNNTDKFGHEYAYEMERIGLRLGIMGWPAIAGINLNYVSPRNIVATKEAEQPSSYVGAWELPITESKPYLEFGIAINFYSHVIR